MHTGPPEGLPALGIGGARRDARRSSPPEGSGGSEEEKSAIPFARRLIRGGRVGIVFFLFQGRTGLRRRKAGGRIGADERSPRGGRKGRAMRQTAGNFWYYYFTFTKRV